MTSKKKTSKMIAVVDYGIGNIGSIVNILRKVGENPEIISDPQDVVKYDKIVLPGVGAFDVAMSKLESLGWVEPLNNHVSKSKYIMGICLGMQLMTKSSDEGVMAGLGWIDAKTVAFDLSKDTDSLRIPHMGWNIVDIKKENILFDPTESEERFYFVHSYHVVCNDHDDVMTTTHYGYDFVSSFRKNNIIGIQFHPEKSHRFGIELFRRFVENGE